VLAPDTIDRQNRGFPLQRPTAFSIDYDIYKQPELIREIQTLLLEKMSIRVESAKADLLTTGTLDSLGQIHLLAHLEKHFGVRLPMEDLEMDSFLSLANIAEVVAKGLRTQSDRPASLEDLTATGSERGLSRQTVSETEEFGNLISDVQTLLLDKLSIRAEPEVDLLQTGVFDSMTLVSCIIQLEEHFGFHLPMEDLDIDSFHSVATIAQLVGQRTRIDSQPKTFKGKEMAGGN